MKIFSLLISLILLPLILFSNTFYIDPVHGDISNEGTSDKPWSTLTEVIENGYIHTQKYSPLPYDPDESVLIDRNPDAAVKAGDTLILRTGMHGYTIIDQHYNKLPIVIMAEEGHRPVFQHFRLRASSHWELNGLEIDPEVYDSTSHNSLIFIESHSWRGPAHNIIIKNCDMRSGTAATDWSRDEWNSRAISGIRGNGNKLQFINNRIENISHGITGSGERVEIINNTITNFSGDGIRPLGSHIIVDGNQIKNCFNVNDNHDDGIQSFNLGDGTFDSVIIRNNIIINHEDYSHPLAGTLQGIGCFDGFYSNWIIENNVVSVNHYHGITLMGATDCIIRNNTVIDPIPEERPGSSWIMISDHKDGRESSGCIVMNNLANSLQVKGETRNNIILETSSEYAENFVDFENQDFRLLENSIAIDSGTLSLAPETDIDGVIRPQGDSVDIGAYEYPVLTIIEENQSDHAFKIFPNPAESHVVIELPADKLSVILLINQQGEIVMKKNIISGERINLPTLKPGIYYFHVLGMGTESFVVSSN